MRLGLQGRFSLAVAIGLVLLASILYLGWRTQERGYEQLAGVERSIPVDEHEAERLAEDAVHGEQQAIVETGGNA